MRHPQKRCTPTVWNAADRIGRERQIAYWAYLGGDSAACAVAAGRPGRAMELLEQGRGVLWSQTLNRRTDTTALVSTVKALADRLVAIRSELDQPTDRPV